jgi:hypothetical protein
MPSRRDVLATLSVCVAGGSLAGCSALGAAGGYIETKEITGKRRQKGGLRDETVVSVGVADLADDPVITVAKGWATQFTDPNRLQVSSKLHDRLMDEYEQVGYVVGVCSPDWSSGSDSFGCYTGTTHRDDFNRAEVGDRVQASYSNSNIEIRSVDGSWFDGEKERS